MTLRDERLPLRPLPATRELPDPIGLSPLERMARDLFAPTGEFYINPVASGTDPVIHHAAFDLLADGSATFSGALSAVTGTFDSLSTGVTPPGNFEPGLALHAGATSTDGGQAITAFAEQTAAAAESIFGIHALSWTSHDSGTFNNVWGVRAFAGSGENDGDITLAIGLDGQAGIGNLTALGAGGGTVTQAVGVRGSITGGGGAGAITTAIGLETNAVNGTINYAVGLQVAAITSGSDENWTMRWQGTEDAVGGWFGVTKKVAVADAGTIDLGTLFGTNNVYGVLFVILGDSDDGFAAIYTLCGNRNQTVLMDESETGFTVTKDNASTVNVYWDAVDSRYELQNLRGGARDVSLILLGM